MGGLEDVLALLITDRSFREELTTDPAAALAGYDLSREDLEVLAASLDEQVGGERAVEQRTSKSTLLGVLGALAVDDDAASGLPTGKSRHNPFPVVTPHDQGSSGNVAGDELELFAEPMEEASASPEGRGASSFQQSTEVEIQSLQPVADDGAATGGDMVEAMDVQTGIDVPDQDAAAPAGSDGDPDAPIVVGSPWNDADAAQYQESDLDFVHERSRLEVEHGDLSAGEPAAEGDGEAIAWSSDVKLEGKNGIEAEYELQQHDTAPDAAPEGADDIGEHQASIDEDGA